MIKLIEGDCLEEMKEIKNKSIDMILCDLPYGTTKCKWDSIIDLDLLWEEYKRIIKDNGAIVLTATQPFSSRLVMSNPKIFKYEWVWDKKKPTNMLNAKHQPLRRHEVVLVFYKKKPTYNPQKIKNPKGIEKRGFYNYNRKNEGGETVGKIKKGGVSSDYEPDKLLPISILQFSKPNKPLHPTQKPVELFEYLIKTYTNEGDLVLDNCAGSGTTGIACKNLGRNCIMIEKEPEYCDIIRERMNTYE